MPLTRHMLSAPESFCGIVDDPETADLAWLAVRGASVLAAACDALAVRHGLSDLRDWLVLSIAGDGTQRTQLEIATQLAIDKSTMVLILDRLERDGLIVRTSVASDRRVRIPESTDAGKKVQAAVEDGREATIAAVLEGITPAERATFRDVLWHLTGLSN